MDEYITRHEQNEFSKRMESENDRQNARLSALETSVQQISRLASNTEKLATNMENMLKVQEKQGQRIEALEGRDGEMWRKAIGYIITAVIGAVLGFLFRQVGL